MPRRASPPLERPGYLEPVAASRQSVRAPESPERYRDDDGPYLATEVQHYARQSSTAPPEASLAAPPSYATGHAGPSTNSGRGPRPLSSPSGYEATHLFPIHGNPFARPELPASEAEYHWGDDAASTIRPDDSVSQLDRRFTGKRGLTGPRAIPASTSVQVAPVSGDVDASYGWVDPAALPEPDDADTLVGPTGRAIPQSPAASMPPPPQQYYPEDEHEEEFAAYHSSGAMNRGSSSSAALPLVGDAAPMAGYEDVGSAVKPYQGYAAVGHADESDDEYRAPSRSRDPDLEHAVRGDGSAVRPQDDGIREVGATTFLSALSYVKSLRGTPSSMNKGQFDSQNQYGDSGWHDDGTYPPQQRDKDFQDAEHRQLRNVESMQAAPTLQRLLYDTTPNELRIHEHKRGLGVQKRPWACWILSLIMVAVMIYELVHMSRLTGSPIQTKPSFNVMIGPSGSVLINLGARFAGCIKYIANITDIDWVCLAESNSASVTSSQATCSMSDICGWGGFTDNKPDQSFRFFVPIFLHAGVVHIILNLLAQIVSSAQVERQMGTPKFLLLYIPAGIFGFVLGANFALVGQPSVGASGAIFGTHAAILVDLLAHWDIEYRPKRKLFYLGLEIVVGLALGLVPGVDNFAHIGGFAVGLLMSILLFPIIHQTKRHRIIFIVLRCIAAPVVIVLFVVLIRNFYDTDPQKACEWCRYLSCWPTASNNHCKGTGLESISSSSSMYFGTLVAFLVTLL